MRVQILAHSLRRGGAERVLLEIALGLQKRGHQVEVIAWLDVDEYQDACYSSIKRHYLLAKDKYRWLRSIPRSAVLLRKFVTRFNPDVVEIHAPNVTWLAACAGLRIPCIHVLHGYGNITRISTLKDKLIRHLSRFTARVLKVSYIVVSKSMMPVAAQFYGSEFSNFTAVPNGVDLMKYMSKRSPPVSPPAILMLGTLSPNKGQVQGIRAFTRLLKYIPEALLIIVGDGVDRDLLNALVQDGGLTSNVKLLGTRDDVPNIFAATHILWQLSVSEAMPMVVIEAMASGVPVIGFDVRGTNDVIVDKTTGYLVPFGDVTAIADKTVELLNDETTYQSFALEGRTRVEKFYDNECMLDGHENTLRTRIRDQQ